MSLPSTFKENAAYCHVSRLSALSRSGLGRPWEDTCGVSFWHAPPPITSHHITSQAGWLRLDPTGEGEASSGAGGPRVPAPLPLPCPCCCRLTVLETASEEGMGLVEGLYHSPFYQGELSLRWEANTDTLRLPGGMC